MVTVLRVAPGPLPPCCAARATCRSRMTIAERWSTRRARRAACARSRRWPTPTWARSARYQGLHGGGGPGELPGLPASARTPCSGCGCSATWASACSGIGAYESGAARLRDRGRLEHQLPGAHQRGARAHGPGVVGGQPDGVRAPAGAGGGRRATACRRAWRRTSTSRRASGMARFGRSKRAKEFLSAGLRLAEEHRLNVWYFKFESELKALEALDAAEPSRLASPNSPRRRRTTGRRRLKKWRSGSASTPSRAS